MAETRRLNELVARSLEQLRLPPGPVVVALSGGADSAALALLVGRAGVGASALHVNHQLTGSVELEAAARRIAKQLELSIRVDQVTVGTGPSPENQARNARYGIIDREERPVLTAHTLDDNAETILLNLIRGTGTAGLRGIPPFRPPRTYRPLLGMARDTTREIAALAGLDYIDDPMNNDPSLTRNRIRRDVLPVLRQINPQVVESLARTADMTGRDAGLLDDLANGYEVGDSIATSILVTIPRPIADRLLIELFANLGIEPSSARLERVWWVVLGDADSQEIARGRVARRRGAMLVIE